MKIIARITDKGLSNTVDRLIVAYDNYTFKNYYECTQASDKYVIAKVRGYFYVFDNNKVYNDVHFTDRLTWVDRFLDQDEAIMYAMSLT